MGSSQIGRRCRWSASSPLAWAGAGPPGRRQAKRRRVPPLRGCGRAAGAVRPGEATALLGSG
eukprot:7855274-Lingulodinium_polyedra.AAC.1